MLVCPLCCEKHVEFFYRRQQRAHGEISRSDYFQCGRCGLVFLQPGQRLEPVEEKRRYLSHNNSVGDAGYRQFLCQLWNPLKDLLPEGAKGLDFGSGPTAALCQWAQEDGVELAPYDPFFYPENSKLNGCYDFVTCTEVVEHFYEVHQNWSQLQSLLKPQAYLGVMTKLLVKPEQFASWYYHQDPTHVSFYQPRTMHWIAEAFSWEMDILSDQVIIFRT